MKIIQNLVGEDKYWLKCPYLMNAEIIVVHNTANDASAINEIAYMIRNNEEVSYHYAIDDKEIVQGIPENRNTWQAGDGNGKGNLKGISIEICYSKSGGKKFDNAEKLASKFIAYKLKEKNWDISRVKKHQDFSGKYCPHRTLDLGWERFLKMIQQELDNLNKGDETMTRFKDVTEKHWAYKAIDELAEKGVINGYPDGTFKPDMPISRAEVCLIISKIIEG